MTHERYARPQLATTDAEPPSREDLISRSRALFLSSRETPRRPIETASLPKKTWQRLLRRVSFVLPFRAVTAAFKRRCAP